jgi:hypothetical protein
MSDEKKKIVSEFRQEINVLSRVDRVLMLYDYKEKCRILAFLLTRYESRILSEKKEDHYEELLNE